MLSLFIILLSVNVYATKEYQWEGDVSSAWNTNGNWDNNPGSASTDIYNVSAVGASDDDPIISTSSSFTIEYLDVQSNGFLTVSGGTSTVSNDMAVRGGADLVISGGTLNVSGNAYLYDAGSSISISNGNLNVSGTLYLGRQHPNRSDGSNGIPTIAVSGGKITASYVVFDDAEGDNPTMTISGGEVEVTTDLRSDGAPVNITISNTGLLDINDDLEMDDGADVLTMTGGSMTLAGDWTNLGSETLSGGTITLDGSSSQTINVNTSATFNNLSISNTGAGISLSDPIYLNGVMTFTDGIVASGSNRVTFNSGSSHSGASSASYVDGPVSEIGATTFTFPIGDGSNYQPMTITATPGGGTEQFTGQYIFTNPSGIFGFGLGILGVGVNHVSTREYFDLNRQTGTNSSASVVLAWNASSGVVDNLSDLVVCHWNSVNSEWESLGNAGTTGNTSAGTITSNPTSSFSPFVLGSSTSNNPLVVEFLSIEASQVEKGIRVEWATASESSNDYFEVQKRTDGTSGFKTIGTIDSKAENGNSNSVLQYAFMDIEPISHNYYRIKQVDFDGTVAYSEIVYQARDNFLEKAEQLEVMLYPNPILTGNLYLKLDAANQVQKISMLDLYGKEVVSFSELEYSDHTFT
ncbi:MAG: hypothetical protein KDC83_06910 [Flavobacteriales bacterium]|nr:hypothetical protein [Flavobacteriales bacterium]